MIQPEDHPHLARTLDLAAQAGRRTAPNPRVGAVVVNSGAVVGEGWHQRAGEAHAETQALAKAGGAARDATLYTSLEPCAHHGRTPPCVEAIREARIARVVVASVDPDPRVAGQGIAALEGAGIAVNLADGALAERAEDINEDYLVHRREGRAFAALKIAATLDGRIADRRGASRWITGAAARERGRALRGWTGAILVGAGTILADDPELTPPPAAGDAPPFLRCVLDGRLSTPPSALIFSRAAEHPVVIYGAADAPAARRAALERAGAEVVSLGGAGGILSPLDVLVDLGARGVLGVLVEGGGKTHGAFLAAGLADKIYWFLAPRLLGDAAARPAVDGPERSLNDASVWRVALEERLEGDILLTLYPRGGGVERRCSPGS